MDPEMHRECWNKGNIQIFAQFVYCNREQMHGQISFFYRVLKEGLVWIWHVHDTLPVNLKHQSMLYLFFICSQWIHDLKLHLSRFPGIWRKFRPPKRGVISFQDGGIACFFSYSHPGRCGRRSLNLIFSSHPSAFICMIIDNRHHRDAECHWASTCAWIKTFQKGAFLLFISVWFSLLPFFLKIQQKTEWD